MNRFVLIEKIVFSRSSFAQCALPNDIEELEQAVIQMGLVDRPVIVLIGGHILPEHTKLTIQAIDVIAKAAEVLDAAVITDGMDVGVTSAIGRSRGRNGFQFPLIGIAPEGIITWPEGSGKGNMVRSLDEREQLEPHHSHFILVPGSEFGDETKWIVRAASMIASGRSKSLTILVNGGKVSQSDVDEGLRAGRPMIVIAGTGRLADEIASQSLRNHLIKIIPAHNQRLLGETIRSLLS
ncbi:MAG TPA: hypothetical protein VJ785_02565 [Anaerolineales bacterium]|nr:hypothetical protein [Anaerolineales bacterium]